MNNDNLPPGVGASDEHIQGGDPRYDAEAERFALALGDQLDALYDDHQEEIIRLGTEHILLRLDEEARGPDVLDLSDLDPTRIREAIDAWRADPLRVLDEVFAEKKPALVLDTDGAEKVRNALCFIDGAVCALHDDDTTGARPVSDRLAEVLGELFAAFGMTPPVAATWGRKTDDEVEF
jgi:hypothetical protein